MSPKKLKDKKSSETDTDGNNEDEHEYEYEDEEEEDESPDLKRHKSHSSLSPSITREQKKTSDSVENSKNQASRQRTAIACTHCRRRKIRCTGFEPGGPAKCSNCIRYNQACVFAPVSGVEATVKTIPEQPPSYPQQPQQPPQSYQFNIPHYSGASGGPSLPPIFPQQPQPQHPPPAIPPRSQSLPLYQHHFPPPIANPILPSISSHYSQQQQQQQQQPTLPPPYSYPSQEPSYPSRNLPLPPPPPPSLPPLQQPPAHEAEAGPSRSDHHHDNADHGNDSDNDNDTTANPRGRVKISDLVNKTEEKK